MRILIALLLLGACASDETVSSSALSVSAIPRGSTWRYWDRGGDLGSAWRGNYDDAAWASGAGPLGYGETYLRTTVGFGPSSSNKYVTTYFRRVFTVDDPAAVTKIAGELMYDDGAVVYLNGVEIQRVAMPAGTITAATLSTGHEANNAYQSYDWTARKSLLVAGTNVLAVEVHQNAASSSDLVFDVSLAIETASAPLPIEEVQRNSYWQYWDYGGDLGTAWRLHEYGDSWRSGPAVLGYGETYINTAVARGPITTYFTRTFYLSNPSAVTTVLGDVMYDDGFVVYLNGTEVGRAAMPAGAVTAATLSTGHEAENQYRTFDWSAKRNLLRAGTNVLAVEVHQVAASSSDLVFDMGLRMLGQQPPPPPGGEDIARGSVWRYWDGLYEPATYHGWTYSDFNDAVWKTGPGPLGYGETYTRTAISYGSDPNAKTVTAYFRRWFTVDAPSMQTTLRAELMVDDGAVIYLNGHEIQRLHMPAGSISHDTLASSYESGNRYDLVDLSAYSRYLVPGPNLLAVEVHQASRSSSDLTFDLAMQVDTPAVCAIPACGPAVPPPPAGDLYSVWIGPSAVWTVGAGGFIGRRDEASGAWCWCDADSDPQGALASVWGSADDDVWMVGNAGHVVHWDGTAFTTVDIGTTVGLSGIWGSGPDDVWVVGAEGHVHHFDGATWQARPLGAGQYLQAVWGASPDDVWVTGVEDAPYPGEPEYDGTTGLIFRWVPATGTWNLETSQTMYYGFADFAGIDGTSATDVWAVGADHPAGAACSYSQAQHYDGTQWEYLQVPDGMQCRRFYDVAAGAPGATAGAWIVGSGEGGAIRKDGAVWSEGPEPLTRSLLDVDHDGDRMYAVGFDNKIIRWDGTRWVQDW